ncbi:multidrug effflux MFS transporter [Pendulispora rubella]|uniref:Multidrug effflux MFS transporter n=1 Tax=Pendulispora rubella TaxID=2741070 RepID=A0ABZ2L368_9BACT
MGRVNLLVLLGALSALGPLTIDLNLPAFPAMAADLGASAARIQLTLTACLAGLALGQAMGGPLSDRYGRRGPLLAGLAGYVLVSALCPLAGSVAWLIALRFAQGLAAAVGIVIARAIVRDTHSGKDAVRAFSILVMVLGVAPIVAPIVGAQLLRITSWRGVFSVFVVYGLVACAAVAKGLPPLPAPSHANSLRRTLGTFKSLLGDRTYATYLAAVSLTMGAFFSYLSASSFVLQKGFHLTAQEYSLAFAVNACGLLGTGQFNRYLVQRIPSSRLLRYGLTTTATGAATLLVAATSGAGLPLLLLGMFIIVCSVSMVIPNATALAMENYPHAAGSASALLGVFQFLSGAIVAPIAGLGRDGTPLPMAITAVTCGAGALAIVTRNQREKV